MKLSPPRGDIFCKEDECESFRPAFKLCREGFFKALCRFLIEISHYERSWRQIAVKIRRPDGAKVAKQKL